MRPDVPLRTTAFTLEDRWLLWAKARLYVGRLELTGWYFWGRYHRSISLERIEEVEATGDGLVLASTDGSALRIGIDTPEQWASAIATHRDVRGHADG